MHECGSKQVLFPLPSAVYRMPLYLPLCLQSSIRMQSAYQPPAHSAGLPVGTQPWGCHHLQCAQLLLPLWEPGSHHGTKRAYELHLVSLKPSFAAITSFSRFGFCECMCLLSRRCRSRQSLIQCPPVHISFPFFYLCCHGYLLSIIFCAVWASCCSIQFDPAPRDEAFNVKRRTPDYFL